MSAALNSLNSSPRTRSSSSPHPHPLKGHIVEFKTIDIGSLSEFMDVAPLEEKAIRRVRTPAGVARFKQPIGSIIIAGLRLPNVRLLEPIYDGWELVQGKNRKKYDVGKDEDGQWRAYGSGGWDDIVAEDPDEEKLFLKLNDLASGPKRKTTTPAKKSKTQAPAEPQVANAGKIPTDLPDGRPGLWVRFTSKRALNDYLKTSVDKDPASYTSPTSSDRIYLVGEHDLAKYLVSNGTQTGLVRVPKHPDGIWNKSTAKTVPDTDDPYGVDSSVGKVASWDDPKKPLTDRIEMAAQQREHAINTGASSAVRKSASQAGRKLIVALADWEDKNKDVSDWDRIRRYSGFDHEALRAAKMITEERRAEFKNPLFHADMGKPMSDDDVAYYDALYRRDINHMDNVLARGNLPTFDPAFPRPVADWDTADNIYERWANSVLQTHGAPYGQRDRQSDISRAAPSNINQHVAEGQEAVLRKAYQDWEAKTGDFKDVVMKHYVNRMAKRTDPNDIPAALQNQLNKVRTEMRELQTDAYELVKDGYRTKGKNLRMIADLKHEFRYIAQALKDIRENK